ncbi:hypothetical protein FRB99_003005 [Tulasnella sp. 403]|nr:hypothetical protein FRB99_003005 [Tulasnella sp. 403]
MKVLLFGSTGYVALPIAKAFLRAGHDVVGQTRSQNSTKTLEAEEIFPLVADPADASTWRDVVKDVDVVIDAVGGGDLQKCADTILDTVVEEARKARPEGPPLSYIYCSGTWVHGDHQEVPYGSNSDRTVVSAATSNTLVAWRPVFEQRALAAGAANPQSLTVNVIRPAMVYGRTASLFGFPFETARKGDVVFPAREGAILASVHVEDLAEIFVKLAEKSFIVKGIVFDAANNYPERLSLVAEELKRASGAKSVKFVEPSNPFEVAMWSSNPLRPTLARTLLGWEPRRPPLTQALGVYYKAWLASLPN